MGKNQTNKTVLKLTMYDKAEEIEFPLEREFVGILDPNGDLTKSSLFFASKAETFEELTPVNGGDDTANESLQEQITLLQDDVTTLQGQVATLEGQATDFEGRISALENVTP